VWNLFSVQMMEVHVQELLHSAAAERLARAGSVPSRGWLYRRRFRWLCRLGQFLVVMGQRLQRVGLPRAAAREEWLTTEKQIGA
jgi:NADH:ubiquinone oxidoreductase subunit D